MDALFRALGSPHRRRILDLLRDGPRTTGDLAAAFGDLSRFAVMQHLSVLEESGVVVARREGRQRFNHLNAVPLQDAYERWVSGLARRSAGELTALRRHIDTTSQGSDMTTTDTTTEPDTGEGRLVRIENEIAIAAPPERVFAAMSTEQGKWYPYTYGGDRVRAIVFEERVGGSVYEDWGDGAGHWYGTVIHFDPPKAIGMRGILRPAVTLEQYWTFAADAEGGTVLKQSLAAYGPITAEDAKGIHAHGDLTLHADRLRAYCEAPA